ncbi:MAG: hypothetical protein P8X89_24690 [Reinekea sp.]
MKILRIILLAAWVAFCIQAITAYFLHASETGSEIEILFSLKMLVLTAPLGFVISLAISFLYTLSGELGIDIHSFYFHSGYILISWVSMLVVGYIQWFVLVPKLMALQG